MLVRFAGDAVMMSPTLIMTPEEVDEVRSTIHSTTRVLSDNPLSL
jgi:adenosylmethionine-8-amino-7-oxononanoate aminotransferase